MLFAYNSTRTCIFEVFLTNKLESAFEEEKLEKLKYWAIFSYQTINSLLKSQTWVRNYLDLNIGGFSI
jgi:hypothetical protein